MTEQRGRGRDQAKNVAHRRILAEEHLRQYFPRSASLWAKLRSNEMSPDELSAAIEDMITEARSIEAPLPKGAKDAASLNPEQEVAYVLTRIGMREKGIDACRADQQRTAPIIRIAALQQI